MNNKNWQSLKQTTKSFIKKDDGSTAVEFVLIAIPFTYLLVGILEMCLMFAGGAILHGGTADSGRMIRTGQVQAAADPQSAFEDALCDHVSLVINCNELVYEVVNLGEDGMQTASAVEPILDEDGNMQPREFDPGQQDTVTLVRVAYRYPIKTPMFAEFLSDTPDNKKLFMSTVVIKNEPYQFIED